MHPASCGTNEMVLKHVNKDNGQFSGKGQAKNSRGHTDISFIHLELLQLSSAPKPFYGRNALLGKLKVN